ncbi:N-acetylglucosaminyldiphosphoundecaprenol N-acetyl-beta-D-mannosaminyltransferase TarA [Staphylococcus arlettae]|uniref:N-acetylglucosaminyldiphosphoundecaprenol N-acetyl-beta-D-mannosaminyltransferase TarA n=1 Tax=Staphylococcus TaxID=1279 RepID=UPI000390D8DC|nr:MULTISPECIES: N-acetylglucosaminyldiphosphoundecaprenol N-acetyl-beta-D-mannosaminyltransferase TarA [Staphylococcus]ERF49107.1 N-acetylmannosaminyltransferase [Staphylococcus sp. EGD-HP3]MCD8816431.1 WecB/TagA/CpsF family glycosyltransferase [Staphylococcus arlettae]MCP8715072.1 WecB/TagA/CpsF family glycosyltransferase [Staphylococcus arlettae]MDN0188644.1 WecB/TagA/CpsF family glycosyltransferase [Staphylococcus arlettae]MDT4050479.1 N-acetylglucosaminyldiphosphoundecaprenol N-acetyl-bet
MVKRDETDKVDVLSVHFNNVTMDDMVTNVKQFFEDGQQETLFIVTANPEIVDYATTNTFYRTLINSANYTVADGTGVVKASKILRTPLKARVPGIELMESCLKIAHSNHQRVYLLGAKEVVVVKAQEQLKQQYPNIIFDHHHGYIDLQDAHIAQEIKDFKPDYIFVGMGYPKQEMWIEQHRHNFEHTVMMGVGGSLEVFSGVKKRAPKFIRTINLEWVYRLIIDWKRLGRMQSIPRFLWKVMKQMRHKH